MIIGVVPNLDRDIDGLATKQVLQVLQTLDCNILVENEYAKRYGFDSIGADNIYQLSDIIIAIGGDATIIRSAKLAALYDKPVLGVNNGTLGYMAAIEMNELDLLENLVYGKCNIEKRMMLCAGVKNEEKHYCLNDLIIRNRVSSGLTGIELYNEDKLILSYRADGVIVSTPTGSTAYSLSAGGPVMEPTMDCMILTPICAHSIAARSIVLSPDSRLILKINRIGQSNNGVVDVAFDGGRDTMELSAGDEIVFEKCKDHQARLITIKDQSFYDILKNKMNRL